MSFTEAQELITAKQQEIAAKCAEIEASVDEARVTGGDAEEVLRDLLASLDIAHVRLSAMADRLLEKPDEAHKAS